MPRLDLNQDLRLQRTSCYLLHHKALVEKLGIEPRTSHCKCDVLPLALYPLVAVLGFEPRFHVPETRVLPLDYSALWDRQDLNLHITCYLILSGYKPLSFEKHKPCGRQLLSSRHLTVLFHHYPLEARVRFELTMSGLQSEDLTTCLPCLGALTRIRTPLRDLQSPRFSY